MPEGHHERSVNGHLGQQNRAMIRPDDPLIKAHQIGRGHAKLMHSNPPILSYSPFTSLTGPFATRSTTMSLNVLAGAGQSKRALLESKGIYEERQTGEVQLLGGLFNRKYKSGSGSSTPTATPKNEREAQRPMKGEVTQK